MDVEEGGVAKEMPLKKCLVIPSQAFLVRMGKKKKKNFLEEGIIFSNYSFLVSAREDCCLLKNPLQDPFYQQQLTGLAGMDLRCPPRCPVNLRLV